MVAATALPFSTNQGPSSSVESLPTDAQYDPSLNAIVARGQILIQLPVAGGGGTVPASSVGYTNTTSPLNVTNASGAFDALAIRTLPTPYDYGAKGGAADDTATLALWAAGGKGYLPAAFNSTLPVQIPSKGTFFGLAGVGKIVGQSVTGGIIQIGDGTTSTNNVVLRDIGIDGSGTQALKVNNAQTITFDGIYANYSTLAVTDGFWFDLVQVSNLNRLFTNGASITGACFKAGGGFNANLCSNWDTGSNNAAQYAFYFDNNIGSSNTSNGNTFNMLTAQGTNIGLYVGFWGGNVVNGFYAENVVHPIVIGDKAGNRRCTALQINAPRMTAPSASNANYANRVALIDFNYANGVVVTAVQLDGSFNIKTIAPLTLSSGGFSTAATCGAVVNASGVIVAALILNPGVGYGSAPTIAVGGVGTGGAITATVSGGAVNSLTITNGGSGYINAPCIPFIYTDAQDCNVLGFYFNSGDGVQSPLYPWVGKSSTAANNGGVYILNDRPYDTANHQNARAWFEKVDGFAYQHYLFWKDSTGTEQKRGVVPFTFP